METAAGGSEAVRDETRLAALRRYQVLDTEPEPAFDRITDLAAAFFDAPVSIVNFVADERQWFKSTIGIDEQETGLDVSFCVYTVANGARFVVEDLAADERFADNPYVTEEGMRFYAGVPLTTPGGHRIGTLCILDTESRSPSDDDLARLEDLAAMVVDELELRREQAERAATADQLRRSQELLQQAQRLAGVGGWEYDVETDALSWSDETYHIHDCTSDRSIDVETAMSFYTPEARSVIEEHFQRLLDDGGRYELELQIVTAEGAHRWVRTIGEAHRDNGATVRVSGAIQDVTDRVRQREALKAAKEAAEETDRVKTALLSNMNHEFRTPLTSIISFSKLIANSPELADDFAPRILGGGRRLLRTLNAVMDFAELEGDHLALASQSVRLEDVARSVAEEFRARTDRKGIGLNVKGPLDPVTVTSDEHLVTRVLTHLVSNAVKFTEEGTVTVSVREYENGGELRVEDTGIGIPSEAQAKVTDEFFQVSTGNDRTHEGNGIGLTIATRMVDRVGGSLEINSESGRGTTVTVRFPDWQEG